MSEVTQKNLDVIKLFDKDIYLLGTAHVSKASAEQAENLIRDKKPDSVVIELCQSRYDTLLNPDKWKKTDIVSVIKQGKGYVLLSQLILSSFQRRIGKSLNIRPGAEMLAAANVADEIGSEIVLGDRDVGITLKRVWKSLSFLSGAKLLSVLLDSLMTKSSEISEEEIEKLKASDNLDEMMTGFAKQFPEITQSLIYERDSYLASKIKNAPGKTVVAIVGAGHVPGIKKNINESIDLKKLEQIPSPSLLANAFKWLIPLLFVVFLIKGFFQEGLNYSMTLVGTWSFITAVTAGFGAAVGGGHILTILGSALSAPITTIHPLLGSGMVAAVIEGTMRKPMVEDFESVLDSINDYKAWYKNRVLRIFLVLITTSLFGSLGTVLAFWYIS